MIELVGTTAQARFDITQPLAVSELREGHALRGQFLGLATFATTLLQSGVDLKTVQKLLGHKNLESTMRYLAKAESPKVRAKVNAVWAGN